MKCVGIGSVSATISSIYMPIFEGTFLLTSLRYVLALKRLYENESFSPTRTIIVSFVPGALLILASVLFMLDEEIGGEDGMKAFCQSSYFKSLNIGFMLDEGKGWRRAEMHTRLFMLVYFWFSFLHSRAGL